MDLDKYMRHIPGFPKEGILFHDIMPLLQEQEALRFAVDSLATYARERKIDLVLGAEARGFILGAALAYATGVGFAAARKPGKLPWKVNRCEYALEYGTDAIEMHSDAIKPGQRVLIIDDVLATGGTVAATAELVRRLLSRRLGTISPAHEKVIRSLPLARIEALGEALLDFRSKADLTRWLKSHPLT